MRWVASAAEKVRSRYIVCKRSDWLPSDSSIILSLRHERWKHPSSIMRNSARLKRWTSSLLARWLARSQPPQTTRAVQEMYESTWLESSSIILPYSWMNWDFAKSVSQNIDGSIKWRKIFRICKIFLASCAEEQSEVMHLYAPYLQQCNRRPTRIHG